MDVSTLDMGSAAEDGATLTLRHPVTGEDLDTTITIMGSDSPTRRRAFADMQRTISKKRGKNITPADEDRLTAKVLAATTLGWTNMGWHGEALPFTRENALMVYQERPWIREQVDEFAIDRANFFGIAATD